MGMVLVNMNNFLLKASLSVAINTFYDSIVKEIGMHFGKQHQRKCK